MEEKEKLAHQFEEELRDKMFVAKRDYKYNPTRFNQMLAKFGGVETVKQLLHKAIKTGMLSEGFMRLYGEGRPDLTAEHSVCKTKYEPLFTKEEIEFCKKLFEG